MSNNFDFFIFFSKMTLEEIMTERLTLRIPKELHRKLAYTSKSNCRSKNREIEVAIKRYITDYERLHGPIELLLAKEN